MNPLSKIGKLPRLPRGASLASPPQRPHLPSIPAIGDTEQQQEVSDTPTTQDEFLQRYKDYGRGTVAEYAVESYLEKKKMYFYSTNASINGEPTTYYVQDLAIRLLEDTIYESAFTNMFNKNRIESQGYTVVDVTASNLQFGLIDATMDLAMQGVEI